MTADQPRHLDSESIAAYALDLLNTREAEAARSHLAGCDECRGAVDDCREVVAAITPASVELPPGLWARIASAISRG